MSRNMFEVGELVISSPFYNNRWNDYEGRVMTITKVGKDTVNRTTYEVDNQKGFFYVEELELAPGEINRRKMKKELGV